MQKDIALYNKSQPKELRKICDALAQELDAGLRGSGIKVWHGGPVWFLDENPIAGYWVRKEYVQLLFWSGQSFDVPGLTPEGKFKAAEARYTNVSDIRPTVLRKWIRLSKKIQWNYKHIVKNKGKLTLLDL